MASKKWVVVGGGGNGIMVRSGKDMSSAAESEKLATGAVVTAEAIEGSRMKYSKVSGSGPKAGWVSVQAGGKDLLVEVNASAGGQATDALTKVVDGVLDGDEAMAVFNSLTDKKGKEAATLVSAIPELYLQGSDAAAASKAALEAVELFKSKGDNVGLATAYASLASAQLAQDMREAATFSADQAISLFKGLGDTDGQASVLQTKIRISISSGQPGQAVEAAREATRLAKLKKDAKATGAALLQQAEVFMDCSRPSDAVKSAKEARECFSSGGYKKEEASAYIAAAYADMNNEYGEAVPCAKAAADIFEKLGDVDSQANAMYTVATAHIAAIAIKQRTCLLPCQADTRGAIDAAREASDLFARVGNREGSQLASQALSTVLSVNGVEGAAMYDTSSPQSTDSLMGEMGKVRFAVAKSLPKPGLFNRTAFKWRDSTTIHHYTMVWEHKVEGVGVNPNGGYRAIMRGQNRTPAIPLYHSIKSQFANAPDEGPLMIHLCSKASGWQFGTAVSSIMSVISEAITCKTTTILFICVDESPGGTDAEKNTIRQIYLQPTVLGILRSARLEAPNLNVAFLGMDAATWHMYRSQAIAALPDVLQSEETEIHFYKGTPYAPTVVNKPFEPMVGNRPSYKTK